jgi:hypothetical protein
MTEHSKSSRCRVCGAEITYDAALGMWTDRPGHPFCPRPIAVTPAQAGTSQDARCDGTGSARRLQALMAIGHSEARLTRLARYYGAPESEHDVTGLMAPPGRVTVTVSRDTYHAICRLYDDLWDQAPPQDSPAERAAAAAARARARHNDWPTPAALDDDLIDDPGYRPGCGWLPATLAGAPQRPFIAPPASPPARITRRRPRSSGRPGCRGAASQQHRREPRNLAQQTEART